MADCRPARALILILLVGCAGRSAPSGLERPECLRPAGPPDQLTTRPGEIDVDGFTVTLAPPETCGPGTWLGLRGSGERRLVLHPDVPSCEGRPGPDDDCPTVRADAFGDDVLEHLAERTAVPLQGPGRGACGRVDQGYEGWNFAIPVNDWQHADLVIEVIADRMRAWRLGDEFGVSVEPVACGIVL